MSSQTPGRRSTRERRSPRNPSPMNTRAPRLSGLSNVVTAQSQDAAGNDASLKASLGGELVGRENAAANGTNSTSTPVPSTRPRIHMRVKPPPSQSTPQESTPRISPRPRKSGRMSEIAKREPATSSGAEEEAMVTGSNRIEESGDDDYTPTGKAVKGKRVTKKSTESAEPDEPDAKAANPRAEKHQSIVQAAIEVARSKDNDVLAVTLKLLYRQSLQDDSLAILMEAILGSTASPSQMQTFQLYVKAARKESRNLVDQGLDDSFYSLDLLPPQRAKPTSPIKASAPKKTVQRTINTMPAKAQPSKTQATEANFVPTARGRPPAAVAARSRIGRQAVSPQPIAATTSRLGTPLQTEPTMSTRYSKKRPSAEPEASARAGRAALNGDDERPRKRARRSMGGAQGGDLVMQDQAGDALSDVGGPHADSDSDLSELHHTSPEPTADLRDAEYALAGNNPLSSTVHSFRKGGRQLKRRPEPSQKVKASTTLKHGIGLPDEQMLEEKQRFAAQFNRSGPKPSFSELRTPHQPSPVPHGRRPPALDIDGVFTPGAREQLERQALQSPATSSVQGELLIPPPAGYAKPTSRASTPAVSGRSGKTRNQNPKDRMKNSPVKKKTFAGGIGSFANAGGRESPVGVQADGESANLDYCVTCGDSGELVCCDGCPRAFHLVCCDPPYDEDHPPESEAWFCAVCTSKREIVPKPPRSLFSTLVHDVRRHNAIKFGLPKDMQNYFEGVHANDEGMYVFDEAVQAKHRTRATGLNAEGENETFKLRDTKGNFVICFACGLSSAGRREIIRCDDNDCQLCWHVDCLDPPPANPPVKAPLDGRPRPTWRCPAHAVDYKYRFGETRSSHKIRRPKNAKIIDTNLNRGLKNNGNIEIENEPSDDEDGGADDGVVYRVKENSIKLDFMERAKRIREDAEAEQRRRAEQENRKREAEQRARFDFNMRSFADQRAVLALLDFNSQTEAPNGTGASSHPSTISAHGHDGFQQVIHQLIREMPSEVVELMASEPPKRPFVTSATVEELDGPASISKSTTQDHRQQMNVYDKRILVALRDVLNQKLAALDGSETAVNGEQTNGV